MDPVRFDRLAKTLSMSGTRRSALAALAGSLGLLGLPRPVQGRKRRGGGGVTIAGPCGDGSGADNACKRPEQCCTGICEPTQRGHGKRCRCRRKGQPCTETINCCQGAGQNLECIEETCQPRCTGVTCTPLDECHDAGSCDPATGECSNPEKPDGAGCSTGHCCGGVCHECCSHADCPSGFCHGSHVCASKECTADSCDVVGGVVCGRDVNTLGDCRCRKRADGSGLFCASAVLAGVDGCPSCESGQTCVELHSPQCENVRLCANPCAWPT